MPHPNEPDNLPFEPEEEGAFEKRETRDRRGQVPDSAPGRGERRQEQRRKDDRYRNRRQDRHRTAWIVLLSVMVVVETIALIVVFSLLSLEEKEHAQRELAFREGARELEALRPELHRLEEELARMARARLPRLWSVQVDQVLSVEESPVSKIVFTKSGNERSLACEYKVVMHNPGLSSVRVHLDILFFNRAGVQIGRSPIGGDRDGVSAPVTLEPGETRSYSGTADLDPLDKFPVYFMFARRAS